MQSPKTQSASAQQMYDARASKYDDSWHPAFARYIVELAAPSVGSSVLDLACGTGLVTVAAARAVGPTGSVVGVDVSAGMLAEARSKLSDLKKESSSSGGGDVVLDVQLHQHDITDLTSLAAVRGRTFDVLTCASALVLLDDPAAAVRQWAGLLAPGAVMVLDAAPLTNQPAGLALERTAHRLGSKVFWNRGWVRDAVALKHLLEASGQLVVESVEPKEQTGLGTRWVPVEDAGDIFEQLTAGVPAKWLDELVALQGDAVRSRAKEIFKEEWSSMAEDGKVRDEDFVWVALARKTS